MRPASRVLLPLLLIAPMLPTEIVAQSRAERRARAEALHERAQVAGEERRYGEAARLLSEAIQLHNTSFYHAELGFVLLKQGRSREAEFEAREARVLDPDLEHPLFEELESAAVGSSTATGEGSVDDAPPPPTPGVADYERAIRYRRTGALARARISIDRAVEESPLEPLFRAERALILLRLGLESEARLEAREASLIEPSLSHPVFAELEEESGDDVSRVDRLDARIAQRRAAEASRRAAAERRAAAAQDRFERGSDHLAAGRNGSALAAFDEATRLEPGSAWYHTHRAEALRRLGRLSEARAAAEHALELDPELGTAEIILSRIAEARSRRTDDRRTRPAAAPAPLLDRIAGAVQAIAEPIQEELERQNEELEAENRRLLAEMMEDARRREEAERRRQEEERRRRQEAANRRSNPTSTEGGVVNGPTPEERRQAELEEQRRREEARRVIEENRRRREERRRQEEEERRQREEEARRRAEEERQASYPPACRGIETSVPGIEGDFTWVLERCLSAHALMENTRTVTITVHDACEVSQGNTVEFQFGPEGLIRQGNTYTGAWIGDGIDYVGGGQVATAGVDSYHHVFSVSRAPFTFKLSYDTRRHRGGVMPWYWRVTGPDGRYEYRNVRVPLDRSGAYDYRGNYTASVPNCG